MKFTTKVIANYRITIPAKIRKKYNIEIGDFVQVDLIKKLE